VKNDKHAYQKCIPSTLYMKDISLALKCYHYHSSQTCDFKTLLMREDMYG
jgi:hypothetical protein